MTRICILPEKEYDHWNNFVASHPDGWLTHLSQWSEILSGSVGNFQLFITAIIDKKTGEIKAGMPIYLKKTLFSGRKMIGAPLATFFDPLVSGVAELRLLLQAAKNCLDKLGAKYLRIKIFKTEQLFLQAGYKLKSDYVTHILSLDDDLDSIFRRFDRTCVRKNIRKAEKSNLKTTIISDKDELKNFYFLYSRARKRLGLPALPIKFFEEIFNSFVPSGKAIYLVTRYGNIPVASLLIFIYKNRCSAEALGWDINFKSLRPVSFIYWEAIKISRTLGCKYFDFGRTARDNKDLIFFKSNWGTQVSNLSELVILKSNSQSTLTRKMIRLKKFGNHIFSFLPDAAYHHASNLFYKLFAE